jgi:hypothetical protein
MPYVGWKIFAYEYAQDPAQREPVSKLLLLLMIRDRFSGDDWVIENLNDGLKLSHVESTHEVKVKVEANDFTFDYVDGTRTETYLLVMESECLAWKQTELKHKKLMEQVSRRLPFWWRKINCYMQDGEQLSLVYSSNMEPEPPFPVIPTARSSCPIPERLSPQQKRVRPRVVKHPPRQPKRRRNVNTLKELMKEVEKEKHGRVPKSNTKTEKSGVP